MWKLFSPKNSEGRLQLSSMIRQLHIATNGHLVLYSQTVVRQFPYMRRSYDIDSTPFAIYEAQRTYDWRKYERKFAIYWHVSYEPHCRPFCWLLLTLICIKSHFNS